MGCRFPTPKAGRRGAPRRAAAGGCVAVVGLALAWGPIARAEATDAARNRASFQVERSRDVVNDRLQAVVGVTDEDKDPAALADRVNGTMAWALAKAKATPGVTVRSGGYRTIPIDREGRLRHWRATQELVLEGSDVRAVTGLVGELQSRLELQSVVFSVSPEQQRGAEDELIAAALQAFQARAELVREQLGASGYELVELSIQTPGTAPRPMRAMAMAAEREVAPPALEGGRSRLVVRVNGTIELK
jgi:predicted secreted protein